MLYHENCPGYVRGMELDPETGAFTEERIPCTCDCHDDEEEADEDA